MGTGTLTMTEQLTFDPYILSDGKILRMTCDFEQNQIELQLQVRKYVQKKILSCNIILYFENVSELDLLDNFDYSGNYSDIVLVKIAENQIYVSLDPYGNSGQPHESDNFVIKAASCVLKEIS